MKAVTKVEKRIRRHSRIRSKVMGTDTRPRLSVFRSNKHIVAQLINDEAGRTLAAVSTVSIKKGTKSERARAVGLEIAKAASAQKITAAVFDRGGFRYTGRIAAVAEGAREGGLTL